MSDFARRTLAILAEGPLSSDNLGERLWPDGKRGGPSRGGPSYSATAAMWQMGKLEHRTGWVRKSSDGWKWEITAAGREALAADTREA